MIKEPDAVDRAMDFLLNRYQDAYVRTQTRAGPSRQEVVRRLVRLGMEVELKRLRELVGER